MNIKIVYKDAFAVIGKMGQGASNKPQEWVMPIWENANKNFSQIKDLILYNEKNEVMGTWGAMNDVDEQNKRWGEEGKYLAGCEANVNAIAPKGWNKWVIPAQTYIVVDCTMNTYGEIFNDITTDKNINITGTVHEFYPEPGNPDVLQVYFPIANGMLFCQSCGMPIASEEQLGTNDDGSKNFDYCVYCFGNGKFFKEESMEDMIEFCIPNCSNGNPWNSEDEARKAMTEIFPNFKRWKK